MKLLDNQKNLQDNIYLKEKKNLNLEKKIQMMNSQMITREHKIEENLNLNQILKTN